MASKLAFTEDELAVDEALGYPKAYAKLCRRNGSGLCVQGPPSVFLPYALNAQEAARAKELSQLFPTADTDVERYVNSEGFVNLLWKQLSHLGNAGFDPALFRVDTYGNVLYFYADPASPLSWDIDHWFPCSRGGRTVPSNLRILQWQVCRKKHNKLEFLIPWWDLQLGISVNQFLSIFDSKNSDFRNRAFSFLFLGGANEDLGAQHMAGSHTFPEHFSEKKRQVGLAPAAIVVSKIQPAPAVLKPLNLNSTKCSSTAENHGLNGAVQMPGRSSSKENDDPNTEANPYMAIAKARDSLRLRDEAKRLQAEIVMLEDEMSALRQTTDVERANLQDLEAQLIKKRRRVEKIRRLADAQASYKDMLEKMIRDTMHKTVIYKEQLRMNQAATIALKARLEAQRAMCDSSEKELYQKYRQRDEIERQISGCGSDQARKRSRVDDDDAEFHDAVGEADMAETISAAQRLRKELRVFLEEEQRAYELERSLGGGFHDEEEAEVAAEARGYSAMVCTSRDEDLDKKNKRVMEEGSCSRVLGRSPLLPSPLVTEDYGDDDQNRAQIGKDNVDKWLKLFLKNTKESDSGSMSLDQRESANDNHMDTAATTTNNLKPVTIPKPSAPVSSNKNDGAQSIGQESNRWGESRTPRTSSVDEDCRSNKTADCNENSQQSRKRGVSSSRPESPRSFRPFLPSSPSVILGMRKSMDCIRKKPLVMDDNDAPCGSSSSSASRANKLFRSSTRSSAKKPALV